MDTQNKKFELAATLYNEVDVVTFKARLESLGIAVKVDAVTTRATRYPITPDTFGVYVEQDRLAEAKNIFKEISFLGRQPKAPGAFTKFYSYLAVIALLGFLAYLIYQMLQQIYYSRPF